MPKLRTAWKRSVIFVLVLLIIAGVVGYAYLKPLPAITAQPAKLDGYTATDVSLPWPAYGEAAIGAAGYGVLTQHGDQTALPTASIAKVMTALAVLKQKPLNLGDQGPVITINQDDVDSYNKYVAEDGSVVQVAVGQQFTEYQALQALLLPSANNVAETLARWAFGSISGYTDYANQYAAQHGWSSIHITDPSGFLPSTVGSAQDLTRLGITAMQNPVIADVVSQSTATLPTAGPVYNVNKMLGQSGTVGIKTGNSDQDLGAYLFAANTQVGGKTVTVVGAIMNGPDLGTVLHDSLPLIDAADQDFVTATPVHAGKNVGNYNVPWQGKVPVVAQKDLTLTHWKGSNLTTSVTLQKQVPATLSPNQNVGAISVQSSPGNTALSSAAILGKVIQKPSLLWRLQHIF